MENIPPAVEEHLESLKMWIAHGHDDQFIEKMLEKKGVATDVIREVLDYCHQVRQKKRRMRGNVLVLVGSILLLFGFVFTLALFYTNGSIMMAMYGITIVGLIFLVFGLIDIFHK